MNELTFFGKTVFIRPLPLEAVNETYLAWLRDPEVNRYLEVRYQEHSIESLKKFVQSYDQKTRFIWGIYSKLDERHIGTITLYDFNTLHRYCDYGYLIGDKEFWGTPAAIEATRLVFDFAFNSLQVHSISTSANEENIYSIFNYQRLGLTYEGARKEHYFFEGRFVDQVIWGITAEQWKIHRSKMEAARR